jgi:hypothetical protein
MLKCGGSYTKDLLVDSYNFCYEKPAHILHEKYRDFFDEDEEHFINLNEDYDPHTIRKQGKYRYYLTHQCTDVSVFKDYFKFTFVRNPYTKLFSAYGYLLKRLQQTDYTKIRNTTENKDYFVDFKTFVKNYKKVNNISYSHGFVTQYDTLIDHAGIINMNYIGKQENLDNDLVEILTILGVDIKHFYEICRDKESNHSKKNIKNMLDSYDEETFLFVNEYFKKDFDVFGYTKLETFSEFKEYFTKMYEENQHDEDNLSNEIKNYLNKIQNGIKCIQNKQVLNYEILTKRMLTILEEYVNYSYLKNELKDMKQSMINLKKKNNNTMIDLCKDFKDLHKILKIDKIDVENKIQKNNCPICGISTFNELAEKCHQHC